MIKKAPKSVFDLNVAFIYEVFFYLDLAFI